MSSTRSKLRFLRKGRTWASHSQRRWVVEHQLRGRLPIKIGRTTMHLRAKSSSLSTLSLSRSSSYSWAAILPKLTCLWLPPSKLSRHLRHLRLKKRHRPRNSSPTDEITRYQVYRSCGLTTKYLICKNISSQRQQVLTHSHVCKISESKSITLAFIYNNKSETKSLFT